jgi:hypothetical protein
MSNQSDIQPVAGAATVFRYDAQDFVDAQRLHRRLIRQQMIGLTIFFVAAASAVFVLMEDRVAPGRARVSQALQQPQCIIC